MYVFPFTFLRRLVANDADQHLMQAAGKKKFPQRIIDYLASHFEKSFVSDIKKVKNKRGHVFYNVTISDENTLHRLKFNEEGGMVLRQAEPLLELDENEYEIID